MKVLVTGGAGYIGSNLVDVLQREGHAVRVLDIQPASGERLAGSECEFIQGSVSDPSLVDEEHPCHPERTTLGGPVYGITKLACEKLCLAYQRRSLPVTVFRIHGVFSQGNLGQFEAMIRQARAGKPVRASRGAGGEYAHLEDVLGAFLLATDNPEAWGEVFNLAGTHTYSEPEVARYIVETVGSVTDLRPTDGSQIELVEDPTQGMVSVSVDKLGRVLGYEPRKGEFLTGLIRRALG